MLDGRYNRCNCVMGCCKCICFCTTLHEKARIPPASLSYARGQHGLHGAPVILSVRTADPCLEGEQDHDVGQQKRTISCSWVGKEKN